MIFTISKANKRIAELETELAKCNGKSNLSASNVDVENKLNTRISELEKQLEDKAKEIETLKKDNLSASHQAMLICANQGVPMDRLPKIINHNQTIQEEYLSLNGLERVAFYNKHKNELINK